MSEEDKNKEERQVPENSEEAAKTFPWLGHYTKEMPMRLMDHLSKGYSFESFGAEVNVGRSTLYRWVDQHPEFKEAKETGESKGLRLIEQFALSKVRGKILVDDKGREQFNPKLSDTAMTTFLLRTRFHKIYSEKQSINHVSEDGSMTPQEPAKVVVYLPKNGRTKEENE